MRHLHTVLNSLLLIPLTLLPIINPLGGAPVFMAKAGANPVVIRKMARQVAWNCWCLLVASMLVGQYLLDFFGISLPIVRIGGGLLVAASAWRMLVTHADDDVLKAVAEEDSAIEDAEIARRSFFPLTFPLTTGPGTIAASIALGAHIPRTPLLYLWGALVTAAGAAATAWVIWLCYRHAPASLTRLGEIGTLVMMRLFAFVLLCIGIEFIWNGWASLNGLAS